MPSLTFHYGPMDCGKSTLALQLHHNLQRGGRSGVLLTCLDRAGDATISSRLGLSAPAVEVSNELDILDLVQREQPSYVIADEAQFYAPSQIDQLARVVDDLGTDVFAFGIATDFRAELFPGSRRLFEVADAHVRLQLPAICWCGETARFNARIVDGVMVTDGEQVVVGDTGAASVRYVLLCRPHFTARHHAPLALAASA